MTVAPAVVVCQLAAHPEGSIFSDDLFICASFPCRLCCGGWVGGGGGRGWPMPLQGVTASYKAATAGCLQMLESLAAASADMNLCAHSGEGTGENDDDDDAPGTRCSVAAPSPFSPMAICARLYFYFLFRQLSSVRFVSPQRISCRCRTALGKGWH